MKNNKSFGQGKTASFVFLLKSLLTNKENTEKSYIQIH